MKITIFKPNSRKFWQIANHKLKNDDEINLRERNDWIKILFALKSSEQKICRIKNVCLQVSTHHQKK
jgi:hypothetical protein